MALHDDLLRLSRFLVDRNPGSPVEADLRRAVSTAYYALFHLLVQESTMRVVAIAPMWPRVARAFEHRDMRKVCEDYANAPTAPATALPVVAPGIASTFSFLQQRRFEADYDLASPLIHAQAEDAVKLAEQAFADWSAVRSDPAVDGFLTDLLFQSVRKR